MSVESKAAEDFNGKFAWWSGIIVGFGILGLATSIVPLVGVLLFYVGVGVALVRPRLRGRRGFQALTAAMSGDSFILAHSLWLFAFPRGFSIRPMIWNAEVLLVGAGSFLLVVSLGLAAVLKERKLAMPALAGALAIEGLFLGWQVLALAVKALDLKVSD